MNGCGLRRRMPRMCLVHRCCLLLVALASLSAAQAPSGAVVWQTGFEEPDALRQWQLGL